MYLVINKWVIAVKVSNFSGQYLRNRWILDIGVLGYIGIVWPKNTLPKSGPFFLLHPVCTLYVHYMYIILHNGISNIKLMYSFSDFDARWEWVINATLQATVPPGMTRYSLWKSLVRPQARSGWIRKWHSNPTNGKYLSMFLSIRSVIKQIVITIGAYHYCQPRTKLWPTSCFQG